MTDKIGFVDTDNQDQQEPIMGGIEGQNDSRREFPAGLWCYCIGEGDIVISGGFEKKGLIPFFSFIAFDRP